MCTCAGSVVASITNVTCWDSGTSSQLTLGICWSVRTFAICGFLSLYQSVCPSFRSGRCTREAHTKSPIRVSQSVSQPVSQCTARFEWVKRQSSAARGYKFGCVYSYMVGFTLALDVSVRAIRIRIRSRTELRESNRAI